MRKYIYALLLPFLSFSALSAPLVWQAQKGDVNFYFLGSIHAGRKPFIHFLLSLWNIGLALTL
ncbi:hypothetical protein Q8W13_08635 [Photobacterium damselae subsp. piscicida]|nr:hypothetical protein [Photobacterium damselae subsp. piscicida]